MIKNETRFLFKTAWGHDEGRLVEILASGNTGNKSARYFVKEKKYNSFQPATVSNVARCARADNANSLPLCVAVAVPRAGNGAVTFHDQLTPRRAPSL